MWHQPRVMTAVSDLLFLAGGAVLLTAAVIWGAPRLHFFPLKEVALTRALQEIRQAEIEQVVDERLQGNFFTINIEALRAGLEHLPWVRQAEVWRKWPARIEIRIEEHRAAAHWGETHGDLVNTFGEVFAAPLTREQKLPRLSGPPGSAAEVLRRYGEFAQRLQPAGVMPAQLSLSARLAWQLGLENGMLVELGREQAKAPLELRLQRFVDHYPALSESRQGRPTVVDMRYPNGYALRFAANAGQGAKGKK